MRLIRKNFQLIVSLVLALSWFVASNRCALGVITAGEIASPKHETNLTAHEDQDHEDDCPDCPSGHHHHRGPEGNGESSCCQSINLIILETAKPFSCNPGAYSLQAYLAWFLNSPVFEFHVADRTVPFEIDNGPPPGFVSFAESVLQRSILAHAPPALA